MAFPSESNYNKFFSNNSDNESDNEDTSLNEQTPLNEDTPLNEVDFNQFNQTNESLLTNDKVIVFGQSSGKKKNTYIIGLDKITNIPDAKTMLEKMKKTFGCGGSIKEVEFQGKKFESLHLQGDMIKKAGKYLASINIKNIDIRELL